MIAPASPLPWFARRAAVPVDGEYDYAIYCEHDGVIAECFGRTGKNCFPNAETNAEYVRTACNAYPSLLAERTELIAALKQLRLMHDGCDDGFASVWATCSGCKNEVGWPIEAIDGWPAEPICDDCLIAAVLAKCEGRP